MKLPQIRSAVAVADAGSFSAAARGLGQRQPTVSAAVRRLEESIGAPLFLRTTRKVSLTPLGERLMPHLKAILNAEQDLLDELTRYRDPKIPLVRLGLSPLVDTAGILSSLGPYKQRYPQAQIVLKECGLSDMDARLEEQTVDVIIGVGLRRAPGRMRVVYSEEPLRYVPRHGSPSPPHAATITLTEICSDLVILPVGHCGLAAALLRLFEQADVSPTFYRGQPWSYSVMKQWAELGIGGSILPDSKLDQPARFPAVVRPDGAPLLIRHEVVWRRDHLFRPHLRAFVDHLKAAVPGRRHLLSC